MFNKQKDQSTRDKTRIAFIGALIILVIVVGIGISSYYVGKNEGESKKNAVPVIDLAQTSPRSFQKVLGSASFNWSGEIVKVEGTKIFFSIKKVNANNDITTSDIIAIIDDNTLLLRWDITQPPVPNQPDSNKEVITKDQLLPGQQVIVKAQSDLNSSNEVTASSISLLKTPTSQ